MAQIAFIEEVNKLYERKVYIQKHFIGTKEIIYSLIPLTFHVHQIGVWHIRVFTMSHSGMFLILIFCI